MVCFTKCQQRINDNPLCTLILTEIVRWIAMATPIYVSVWRYADFVGYTSFFSSANCSIDAELGDITTECRTQYWGVVTIIFLGGTLFIYAPLKLMCSKTILKEARYRYGWRPSIVQYLLLGALPCLAIIYVSIETSDKGQALRTLDSLSAAAIQLVVVGLTITEWMAKIREEQLTFDLITAFSADFFFAYDVFDFFNIINQEGDVFKSNWTYAIFGFGYLAMFKYVPNQPPDPTENWDAAKQAIKCNFVEIFCNDIPFVVIRLWTMIQYGLVVSDLVHPIKNIALICFDLTQSYLLYVAMKPCCDASGSDVGDGHAHIPQRRVCRESSFDAAVGNDRCEVVESTPLHHRTDRVRRRPPTNDNAAFDQDKHDKKDKEEARGSSRPKTKTDFV